MRKRACTRFFGRFFVYGAKRLNAPHKHNCWCHQKNKKNGKIAEKTSSARQIKSGTLWFNIFSPRYSNIPFFTPKGEACAPHSPLSLFARVSRPCINFNHGGAHAYFPFPRFLLCEGKADWPAGRLPWILCTSWTIVCESSRWSYPNIINQSRSHQSNYDFN